MIDSPARSLTKRTLSEQCHQQDDDVRKITSCEIGNPVQIGLGGKFVFPGQVPPWADSPSDVSLIADRNGLLKHADSKRIAAIPRAATERVNLVPKKAASAGA
jgi:hypothetical protein